MIPPFGPVGVAYAFLISRIVSAALHVAAIRWFVGSIGGTRTLVKCTLAGFIMVYVLASMPWLSLWWGVPLGALLYFAALWLFRGTSREDWVVVWNAIRGALFR